MKSKCLAFIIAVIFNFLGIGLAAEGGSVGLAELTPISEVYVGLHVLRLDEHVATNTVTLSGKAFKDGIGVEAGSSLIYALKGGYNKLEIKIGIGAGGKDFYSGKSVRFSIFGDGRLLYRGGARRYGDAPEAISVALDGVQKLELAARGKLTDGSDPRAAFWAEGRLYKADKPAGEVSAASLRAESVAGPEMQLSAFGEEGLLPEEYRFLRELIEDTGYVLGAELLITRNGAAAALDIAPDINDAGGIAANPHLTSWNSKDFPISHRTYTVAKMFHGISRKKPELVQFKKTAADPALTRADRKKIESFLNSMGAWNRGDILMLEKEGIEASLRQGIENPRIRMMRDFEPKNYKAYQAAPALDLLAAIKSAVGDRAEVVAGVDNAGGKAYKAFTTYGIQIPRSRAKNLPWGVKSKLYLLRGLSGAEPLAALALGVLIFRRKRRLFKYYALFSAIPPAFFLTDRYISAKDFDFKIFQETGTLHAPLLVLFLVIFVFMKAEYLPPLRAVWRWGRAGLKWLTLCAAALVLLLLGIGAGYHGIREPEVIEITQEGKITVKYVRTRPLVKALGKTPGFIEDYRMGWAEKNNNKVTCYVSLSKIDEVSRDIERDWPALTQRRDFRAKLLWNLLKTVPPERRKEYFSDLERRSTLAHELSHGEDFLKNPYADGRRNGDSDWADGEIKARLAGISVSPFGLTALKTLNKEYLPVRQKIFGAFTEYADTPAEEDISSLPPAEISRRAGEIYQRIVAGAGFDYWLKKAQAAASADDKARYYKWALEKWDFKDGAEKRAATYKVLADLRWLAGDRGGAIGDYAAMAESARDEYCPEFFGNKALLAHLKGPKAVPAEKKTYGRGLTACGRHYRYSGTLADKGLAYLNRAEALTPESQEVYQELSAAYKAIKKDDEALAALERGVRKNPLSAGLLLARGRALQHKGDDWGAGRDFKKALQLDPKNQSASLLLARWHYDAGRRREALEAVLMDKEKLAHLYYYSGEAASSVKNYEDAAANYTKAIELSTCNAAAYYKRGYALNELGRYEKALADLREAKKLNPKDSLIHISLGFAYAMLRRHEKALAAFSKAVELDPKSFWGYNNRAWVHMVENRCKEAYADLEKARPLGEDQKNFSASFAMYYWTCRQDKAKAIEAYETAFKKGYKYDEADKETAARPLMAELHAAPEFRALVDKYDKKDLPLRK